ncbi:MAG: twin-arginine translocase TatA/TatE family subunit [Desulfobacteraceae bacterium]|jgi:TatA/E family protein of Tat protein translocase
MFGIGMPEMLVLLAVALIVFGPKKLPELAKSLGRALGEFKRATSDLKQSIETETGIDEVRSTLDDVKGDIKSKMDQAGSAPAPTDSPSNLPPDETPPDKTSDDPVDPDEPLDKVKSAFDELNSDSNESQTAPATDRDPEHPDPEHPDPENPDPEHQDTTKR